MGSQGKIDPNGKRILIAILQKLGGIPVGRAQRPPNFVQNAQSEFAVR